MALIGVIGGTGIYSPEIFEEKEEVRVRTPFGAPSDSIRIAKIGRAELAFLPRHGSKHSIPPHKVNYRANIWALKELGAQRIIGVNAVGSLKEDLPPGTTVVCDQFIDMTKNRENSFYDGGQAVHVSVAEPFCPDMRSICIQKLREMGLASKGKGTYVCIEGPRFSTKAESRFWRQIGGDIIGMTSATEAVLARELELCYLCIATITDYDVWKDRPVSASEVVAVMKQNNQNVLGLLKELVPAVSGKRNCKCGQALKDAVI